ncbi:MAG: hypothetical protein ACM30I_07450 [Gemmatimonas sp.]
MYLPENALRPAPITGRLPVKAASIALSLIFLQLAGLAVIGTQLVPLSCLAIIDVASLFLLARYGLTDANALSIVTAAAFHVTGAAVIKLFLGQPLEQFLVVPDEAFAVELIFVIALIAAFFTLRVVRIPNLFPERITSPEVLRNVAVATTLLHVALNLVFITQTVALNTQFGESDPISNPFLIAIRGFGTLGLVCATGRAVLISNRWKLFDPLSFLIVALNVALGLASNSREGVGAPLVAVFVTAIAFGYRFHLRTLVAGGLFAFVAVAYISPALLIVRADRDTLGPVDRAIRVSEIVYDYITQSPRVAEYETALSGNAASGLAHYFGFYQTLADRFALVQTVDLVVDGIDRHGAMDVDELPDVLPQLIPGVVLSFFGYERPPSISPGDIVSWAAGLQPYGFLSNLAVPGNAEAYAVGGFPAVFYRMFFAYLVCYAAIYLCGGADMRFNVLAITVFLLFLSPSNGYPAGPLYYFALRILPQFAISYFLIIKVAGLFVRAKPSAAPVTG